MFARVKLFACGGWCHRNLVAVKDKKGVTMVFCRVGQIFFFLPLQRDKVTVSAAIVAELAFARWPRCQAKPHLQPPWNQYVSIETKCIRLEAGARLGRPSCA